MTTLDSGPRIHDGLFGGRGHPRGQTARNAVPGGTPCQLKGKIAHHCHCGAVPGQRCQRFHPNLHYWTPLQKFHKDRGAVAG